MTMKPIHSLAELFPLVEGAEFTTLILSIKESGLRDPIILFEDKILDGRNRARACEELGIEPHYETLPPDLDPLAFVLDKNLHRRHLDTSQRAMVAARLATMRRGERTDLPSANLRNVAQPEAAAICKVSERSVTSAKAVIDHGAPEVVQAVERGRISVSAAADVVTQPEETQRNLMAREKKEILKIAKGIRKTARADKSLVGKNPERIHKMQMNAQIWSDLRDVLVGLTGLPLPTDVVSIARAIDRAGLIDARLERAFKWLEAFRTAWGNQPSKEPAEAPALAAKAENVGRPSQHKRATSEM